MSAPETAASLVARAGSLLVGIPVASVVETMRPLPVEVIPGAPAFVEGLAIVRGIATPVVNLRRLFAEPPSPAGRLVIARAGTRRLGILVDEVIGIRAFAPGGFAELPPLLGEKSRSLVAEVGTLDGELLLLLQTARIVPEEVHAAAEAKAS